jgi:hypothetical protein
MTRQKAISQIVAEDPELHTAYLETYNALHAPKQRGFHSHIR